MIGYGNDITVQLGKISTINHIKLLLAGEHNTYSYKVATSLDGTTYNNMVNYTRCHCRSWQNLYFPSRLAKYIRLIGIFPQVLEVVALQAMQKENVPNMIGDIVQPAINVATVAMGAIVLRGGGHNNILNNNSNEYTCHDLANRDGINIQLSQPFYIGSLRILLGNNQFPSNEISFYIETSTNDANWKMVIDKRNENLAPAWYHFEFDEHPIVYINIVGTKGHLNVCIHLLFLKTNIPLHRRCIICNNCCLIFYS